MKTALALLLLATVAHADGGDPVRAAATPAEQTVLEELDKDQLIKARTDAEAILNKHPDSFVAMFAMARVQHDEEGNHARALYFIHRAEGLLKHFGTPAPWDKKLLREEYWILHEMDRMEDALAVIDRYEKKYDDTDETLRIWPLFKLGRMKEARELGRRLAAATTRTSASTRTPACSRSSSKLTIARRRTSGRWRVSRSRRTGAATCCAMRRARRSTGSGSRKPRTSRCARTRPRTTTAKVMATTSSPACT